MFEFECCGYEMLEIEAEQENELGEYEIIGYQCIICKARYDLCGEEV